MTSVPILRDGTGHAFDKQRIIELVLLMLALLAKSISTKQTALTNTTEKTVLLIILLGLLSSFLAPAPTYAFIELAMFIGLWSIITHFAESKTLLGHSNPTLAFSILILVAAAVYLSSFPVSLAAGIAEGGPIHWWDLFRGYDNIRFFNQFQIWTLPLLTLLFIAKPFDSYLPRKIVAVVITCWWLLLYPTAGRGAILAILISTLLVGIIYRSASKGFIKTQLLFALSGFFSFILLDFIIQLITSSIVNMPDITRSGAPGREALWMQALQLIIENPVLGVGPMHYAWHPNPIAAHPHSSFLQWAAEWGIPSLSLIMFLFVYGTYHWLHRFSYRSVQLLPNCDGKVVMGLTCSALAGLGHSLVSGIIVMPMSQIMFAIILGLMIGVYKHSELNPSPATTSFRRKIALWRVFHASVLILLITTIWPSLTQHLQGDSYGFSGQIHTRGPRLWRIGGIPHNNKETAAPMKATGILEPAK